MTHSCVELNRSKLPVKNCRINQQGILEHEVLKENKPNIINGTNQIAGESQTNLKKSHQFKNVVKKLKIILENCNRIKNVTSTGNQPSRHKWLKTSFSDEGNIIALDLSRPKKVKNLKSPIDNIWLLDSNYRLEFYNPFRSQGVPNYIPKKLIEKNSSMLNNCINFSELNHSQNQCEISMDQTTISSASDIKKIVLTDLKPTAFINEFRSIKKFSSKISLIVYIIVFLSSIFFISIYIPVRKINSKEGLDKNHFKNFAFYKFGK